MTRVLYWLPHEWTFPSIFARKCKKCGRFEGLNDIPDRPNSIACRPMFGG